MSPEAGSALPDGWSRLLITAFLAMALYAPIFLMQYLVLALPVRRARRRFWLTARHFDFVSLGSGGGPHAWAVAPRPAPLRPPLPALLAAMALGLVLVGLAAVALRDPADPAPPAWLAAVAAIAVVGPIVLRIRFGEAQASWVSGAVRQQLAARFARHLSRLDEIAAAVAALAAACARLTVEPPPSPLPESRDLILEHARHPALARADAAAADLARCLAGLKAEIAAAERVAAEIGVVGEAIAKAKAEADADHAREIEQIELTLYAEDFLTALVAWNWNAGLKHLAGILDRVNTVLIAQSSAGLRGAPGNARGWIPGRVAEAYEFLNINPSAEEGVMKTLVNAMRRNWHPDHAVDEADRSAREAKMKQINVAWDMIRRDRETMTEAGG